ncbi:LuxR C-terminal-related transcriptional regulator [Streptomyces sp. NPDC053542]|uniref:LuxR C-terminal-related transcriptional regulator n=1 Tax=Streptomyces sp. NPDC053542 TaxID=3365710 RepID=UPI0037D9851C
MSDTGGGMTVDFSQRRSGALPVEVTGFVGRVAELTRVRRLLGEARLVTLLGPGGVGKSRVALRTAAALKEEFPDGIWLAELSALRSAELLPQTMAAVLGLPEQAGRRTVDALVEHLQDRQALLVLDTCEHLVDACAMLADLLLREAPRVRILTTSREPLDVPGEHTVQIPPLPVEDTPEARNGCGAVALFAQRAAAVVPGFTVTAANRPHVVALCRRLDGIPLAVELAAVRLRAIPLAQLVARLEGRFEVLTGSRRAVALPRHQTLRTAIGWSHELCTPEERLLWARLSVFAGSFDLAAAEDVCGGGELPAGEVVEHLIGLVDKSVVLRAEEGDGEGAGDGSRYRLLDTIREYGAEWLEKAGEAKEFRGRHFAYYRRLGDRFRARFLTDEQLSLYEALLREQANLRAALGHAVGADGDPVAGLELAARLWPFWRTAGLQKEGRHWIGKALELVPEERPERAAGLLSAGMLCLWQGDPQGILRECGRARELAERLGDAAVRRWADGFLGLARGMLGEIERSAGLLAPVRAEMVATGDRLGTVMLSYHEAFLRITAGDCEGARALCEVALRYLDAPEERVLRSVVLSTQGLALWRQGQRPEGARLTRTALRLKSELHERYGVAYCAEVLAWDAAEDGRYARAAWVLGVAQGVWRSVGATMFGMRAWLEVHDRVVAAARRALGDCGYDRLFEQGLRLPLDRAVQLILADAESPTVAPRRTADGRVPGGEALTRREREVAALVADGLSNREIAERLVISKRTADAHVEHIFTKLGVSSRTEIADRCADA